MVSSSCYWLLCLLSGVVSVIWAMPLDKCRVAQAIFTMTDSANSLNLKCNSSSNRLSAPFCRLEKHEYAGPGIIPSDRSMGLVLYVYLRMYCKRGG